MKKIITLSLIITMLALSGCGKANNPADESAPKEDTASTSEQSSSNESTAKTEEQKQAEAKLDGVTTEKIEQMADEINAAKESGDKEKEKTTSEKNNNPQPARLKIVWKTGPATMGQVLKLLNQEKADVLHMNTLEQNDKQTEIMADIQVRNQNHLNNILNTLKKQSKIVSVNRENGL